MDKFYLGDSVYVQHDGFGLILTTDNGAGPSNTIYLEPDLLGKLNAYVAGLQKKYDEQEAKPDAGS